MDCFSSCNTDKKCKSLHKILFLKNLVTPPIPERAETIQSDLLNTSQTPLEEPGLKLAHRESQPLKSNDKWLRKKSRHAFHSKRRLLPPPIFQKDVSYEKISNRLITDIVGVLFFVFTFNFC